MKSSTFGLGLSYRQLGLMRDKYVLVEPGGFKEVCAGLQFILSNYTCVTLLHFYLRLYSYYREKCFIKLRYHRFITYRTYLFAGPVSLTFPFHYSAVRKNIIKRKLLSSIAPLFGHRTYWRCIVRTISFLTVASKQVPT